MSDRKKRAFVIIAALSALLLIVIGLNPRKHRDMTDSEEQVIIKKTINSAIKVGDNDETVRSFFTKQGWKADFDPLMKGYFHQVEAKSALLEKHLILIQIGMAEGRVTKIEVIDFYRTI